MKKENISDYHLHIKDTADDLRSFIVSNLKRVFELKDSSIEELVIHIENTSSRRPMSLEIKIFILIPETDSRLGIWFDTHTYEMVVSYPINTGIGYQKEEFKPMLKNKVEEFSKVIKDNITITEFS